MSMNMSRSIHRVSLYHEAMSPITHMSRTSGNEALVAREPVVTPRGVVEVPCLSGNAIRHRCVREPLALWLVQEYGLAGKLTLPQLNFLFHGGNLTEGGGRENTARIAEFERLFPSGRLLGGCLPDQILSGSLQCGRGTLVCEENRSKLDHSLYTAGVEVALPGRLRPAETFVSGYQYTRGDAAKSYSRLARAATDAAPVDSNLMIFSGQSVTRGAAFLVSHVIDGSILDLGAFYLGIGLWQAAGGTIGGQASRGHGQLSLAIIGGDAALIGEAVDAYTDYARSVKDEAVTWLHSVFAPKADRPAKGAKGKAKTGTGVEPSLIGGDE